MIKLFSALPTGYRAALVQAELEAQAGA